MRKEPKLTTERMSLAGRCHGSTVVSEVCRAIMRKKLGGSMLWHSLHDLLLRNILLMCFALQALQNATCIVSSVGL